MTGPPGTLPTGTVTFLFTDIEGSTRARRAARARCVSRGPRASPRDPAVGLRRARRRRAWDPGRCVPGRVPRRTVGRRRRRRGQRALAAEPWPPDAVVRVRMGLHTGEGIPGGDDYVGSDINRAARVAAAAHGGQVLLSEAAMALTRRSLPEGVALIDLGEHRLRGLVEPERLYQLTIDGLPAEFPPIRTVHVEPAHLPPRMTSFVGRETRARRARAAAGRQPPGHPPGSRRDRQDEPRRRARPERGWRLPRWRLVRPARRDQRAGPRRIVDRRRARPARHHRPDRARAAHRQSRRSDAAPRARQLRAGPRGRRHRRRDPRRARRRSRPSRPAGHRSGWRPNRSSPSARCPYRPRATRRSSTRSPAFRRSACSWIASGEHNPRSRCRPRTSSRQPTSVVGSTACRSGSSWRQRGSRCLVWPAVRDRLAKRLAPAGYRQRRRPGPPADPPGHRRLEPRPARSRRAVVVRRPRRVRRRLSSG